MTIRPIVLNGTIQRTQDIGTLKQQEDTKPLVDQQNIQGAVVKEEQRLSRQVIETNETEQEDFRYDAKEKGNSEQQKNKKKKSSKDKKEAIGTVTIKIKGQSGGFDMKI